MRTLFIALLLWSRCSTFQAAEAVQFPSGGAVVLPPSLGAAVLNQCSREAPDGVSEFWKPSPEQIAQLEGALVKHLLAQRVAGNHVPPENPLYLRQYVGYIKGGQRYIYGNFFPHRVGRAAPERLRPLVVCDGGPSYWGIVYRVDLKSFEMLRFNGAA